MFHYTNFTEFHDNFALQKMYPTYSSCSVSIYTQWTLYAVKRIQLLFIAYWFDVQKLLKTHFAKVDIILYFHYNLCETASVEASVALRSCACHTRIHKQLTQMSKLIALVPYYM